jgi:hypothetical protein
MDFLLQNSPGICGAKSRIENVATFLNALEHRLKNFEVPIQRDTSLQNRPICCGVRARIGAKAM